MLFPDDLDLSFDSTDEQHDAMPLDRRRSSPVLDTSDVQIDIEMEDEETTPSAKRSPNKPYSNGERGGSIEDINRGMSFHDKIPESAQKGRDQDSGPSAMDVDAPHAGLCSCI